MPEVSGSRPHHSLDWLNSRPVDVLFLAMIGFIIFLVIDHFAGFGLITK